MSRFSEAVFAVFSKSGRSSMSTDELWAELQKLNPDLTAVHEKRKTPRNTMMRDLRVDRERRFVVRTIEFLSILMNNPIGRVVESARLDAMPCRAER